MVRKIVNWVIALTLIVGVGFVGTDTALKAEAAEAKLPFKDIEKHWAKDNIISAYNSGLVDGFPDGTFRPNDVVKADQFVVMMLKAFSKTTDGKTEFDEEWIMELADKRPDIAMKLGSLVRNGFDFKPAKSGYWAKPFIDLLYEIDYLPTFDEIFPKNYEVYKKQIKREQASYLLGEWYTQYDNTLDPYYADFVTTHSGLKDFNTFTNTSVKNYRAHVMLAGLMVGYPNGNFYPHRFVTRAEALTMVQRLRDETLRTPYKPDLTGQYYAEVKGNIYLISDKFKYDMYNSIVALAKKHVTKGYISQEGLGFGVYDSQDTAKKNDFLVRIGDLEKLAPRDLSVGVAEGTSQRMGVAYPINKKMPYAAAYFDALLDLFAGNSKGKELKTKLAELEISLGSKPVEFTFNNRKFELYSEKSNITLTMKY
ncbi:S-layer homology domain-containing protein [Paenibacillus sp. 2TAB19]|uniref:S-layer homology domain-containing protein n=1 Tax=Paenibacillus sp. 2TAB19 TaxID=3233003 RepID=UPI003F9C4D97